MHWRRNGVGVRELLFLIGVLISANSLAQDTTVSFKSWQGKYLVAENGGGDTVNANRTAIGSWERFVIEGASPVMDGDKIHIRTVGNYYFCSETSGNLIANRKDAKIYETFTLINHSNPGGRLRNNDIVSLKSYHNKYVVAESDGTANANRTAIGPWERFTVVAHSLPVPPPMANWESLENVALGKSSSQVSTGHSAAASRAVDGDTNGEFWDGSVTHTNSTAAPWWMVDLGAPHRVQGVSIWNRTDCCGERLANFHVDYLGEAGEVIASKDFSGKAGVKTNIDLAAQDVYAVSVQLYGTNILSLAEVQVFGSRQFARSVIEERIDELYGDILGREPSPSELAYYAGRVDSGSVTFENVAKTLFHSGEFKSKNEGEQATALYWLILDRGPTGDWLSRRAEQLHTGEKSLYSLAVEFVNTNEFSGLGADHKEYIAKILNVPAILNTATHNNSAEQRKAYFREMIVEKNSNGVNTMPILAYEGVPIRTKDIEDAIDQTLNMETGDFRLAVLVRLLYLTEDYDSQILPRIAGVDYWLTKGEDQYCYWSENHMILWMSSAYLLKQREGWNMDANLEKRLRHYLDLKLKYGFYEFFSTTYLRYTLGALLNLADFAGDADIRSKATAAAKKLMKEWLLVTNDKGAIYPAAGRNYAGRYTTFGEQAIAWIGAGIGPMTTGVDISAAFLSTSDVDLRDVGVSWKSSLDMTFTFGHPASEHQTIHADQTRIDRTIFQWSSGGYFHPDTADDTTYLVDLYDLEANHHFDMFKEIPDFPDSWSSGFSKIGATFSRSSNISTANVKIYKNRGTVLTSIHDYFAGYRGYQQWPWAATADDIAVWTQSGKVGPGWQPGSSLSANSHLPRVQQSGNVAMITYFPNLEIRSAQWFDQYDTEVSLYWPTERFDESIERGRWIIGRKGDSYVAVLRYRNDKKNGFWYSSENRGRQLWAVVVGNKDTHGSFGKFVAVIEAAKTGESFDWDFKKFRRVYKTSLTVDGKSISSKM